MPAQNNYVYTQTVLVNQKPWHYLNIKDNHVKRMTKAGTAALQYWNNAWYHRGEPKWVHKTCLVNINNLLDRAWCCFGLHTVVAEHHASVAPSHHLYCSFHASILYGGKSAKFRGNAYRLFLQFLFLQNECMTLWPHSHQLMATPNMQTEETTLNDKVKKQACARMV